MHVYIALLSPARCLTKCLLDDCTGDSHFNTLDCHSSCRIFKGPTIAPLLPYFYKIWKDLSSALSAFTTWI